jgi:hypothetical protein
MLHVANMTAEQPQNIAHITAPPLAGYPVSCYATATPFPSAKGNKHTLFLLEFLYNGILCVKRKGVDAEGRRGIGVQTMASP